ncbi:uncharacterized protein LOC120633714 [Pararge aegeria]|uniref:Jg21484 protein n=2 Tax=Pararge aegeria TaxID=116150 RepID=A0A8S4RP93_9NEOP|nr:uncharacterized protein LOC120633714 [Pararge aegeria]CAH2239477.1 jg21484 [Pararge aegeria aegeria]
MVGFVALISLSLLAVCNADIGVDPPVKCGSMPPSVYSCLGTPRVVNPKLAAQCDKTLPECEKLTCIFRKSGWMDGDKVDKVKLTAYFDQFATDNPDWQPAVDNLKTTCLQGDLPAQGVLLNCPAYDAMQCTFASFLKHAQPSQWSTSESCNAARQYAASCPVCPTDCFASQIPVGSCNACLVLPRSP